MTAPLWMSWIIVHIQAALARVLSNMGKDPPRKKCRRAAEMPLGGCYYEVRMNAISLHSRADPLPYTFTLHSFPLERFQ